MKRILLGFATLILVLFVVIAMRASTLESLQPVAREAAQVEVDLASVTARFAEALTYPTISHESAGERDDQAFLDFHAFLERSFPAVHAALERETVSSLSLLYTWEGREPDLAPVLLMGHMDVVPVIPCTEEDRTHPPFGGVMADGAIWGRGALDDKASVMAILEAVEHLVLKGFRPRRTTCLAFGHDEEVGGPEGAGRIAETFATRGVEPYAFVLGPSALDGSPGPRGLGWSAQSTVAVRCRVAAPKPCERERV